MNQTRGPAEHFNPFEDRLSRDIRNDLSESVIEVINSRSLEPAERAAEKYSGLDLAPVYRAYIDNRLKSYGSALARLPSVADELLKTAGIFWDQGLFFEVHEILEPVWMKASGAEKLLLQALIRSAGVYIYLELGYRERAAKIAAKTIPVLKQNRDRLRQDLMADELIAGLEALAVTPPFLTKEAS